MAYAYGNKCADCPSAAAPVVAANLLHRPLFRPEVERGDIDPEGKVPKGLAPIRLSISLPSKLR